MKGLMLVTLLTGLAIAALPFTAFAFRTADGQELDKAWKRYLSEEASREPVMRFPHEECFKEAAQTYNLPVSLLLAVARGESDFNAKAKSDRDCYGLMQIRWPITANHLGITKLEDLFDPCTNVLAGAGYLRELSDRYGGNLHLVLAAYNYGPGRIPRNVSPDAIPDGARWYSGYILHHLEYVMKGSKSVSAERPLYKPENKLEIIVFNKPYRARGFYGYIQEKAPSLRLDWFRTGLGRFQVVLFYKDSEELKQGKAELKRLGFSVRP